MNNQVEKENSTNERDISETDETLKNQINDSMGEDSEADQIDWFEEDRRGEKSKPIKSSEIQGCSRKNEEIDNPDDVGTLLGIFWFNLNPPI